MSLILQGIDMPIETDYLRLALFRSGRDNEVLVFDDATNTLIGEAIQIPKGHGRLIDGDALENTINYDLLHRDEDDGFSTKSIWSYIKNAPTILEAEEE